MKQIYLYLFLSLGLMSACATANRSTRGLNPGTVNISYMPPFSGAVRVGLSKNIESRFSYWYSRPVIDLFTHTSNPDNLFNYGLAGGIVLKPFWYNASEFTTFYFTSLTVGSSVKARFYPYLTFSYYSDLLHSGQSDSWDLAAGCETLVYKFKDSGNELILTPEIILAPYFDGYPFNTMFLGTVGFGISFDLNKL